MQTATRRRVLVHPIALAPDVATQIRQSIWNIRIDHPEVSFIRVIEGLSTGVIFIDMVIDDVECTESAAVAVTDKICSGIELSKFVTPGRLTMNPGGVESFYETVM